MAKERLDKIVSLINNLTRSEARRLIKIGVVCVNGIVVKDAGKKVSATTDKIVVDGIELNYQEFVYIMLHKPKGVISASSGNHYQTVIDLLPDEMKRKNLFPAGRLDKDTTGFVLITDDGALAHDLLSPRHHVSKTYHTVLDNPITSQIIEQFQKGVVMQDGTVFQSATLTPMDATGRTAEVVLHEGKYHQIKRMFLACGCEVLELHRCKIAEIPLDETLPLGECRYLLPDEVKILKSLQLT